MTIEIIYMVSNVAVLLMFFYAVVLVSLNKDDKPLMILSIAMLVRALTGIVFHMLTHGGVPVTSELLQPSMIFGGYPLAIIVSFYPFAIVYPEKLTIRWSIMFILPMIMVFIASGLMIATGMIYTPLSDIAAFSANISKPDVIFRIVMGVGCIAYPVWAAAVAIKAAREGHPQGRMLGTYGAFLMLLNINFMNLLLFKPLLGLFLQQTILTALFTFVFVHFFVVRNRQKREELALKDAQWKSMPLEYRINYVMENNKPYRNPSVKLPELASITATNRTAFSSAIKEMGYQSVPDFLNHYRLEEFKREVKDNNYVHLDELATKVGFGSKATFFRYFREKEGTTPAQYAAIIRSTEQAVKVVAAVESVEVVKPEPVESAETPPPDKES